MPTEALPTSVVTDRTISVSPGNQAKLDAAAHAGQSRAERFSEGQVERQAPDPQSKANFDRDLAAARARDLGSAAFNGTKAHDIDDDDPYKAPKERPAIAPQQAKIDDEEAPPSEQAKPRASVPGLPEWRPKGTEAGKQWDEMKARHSTELAQIKAEADRLQTELRQAASLSSPEVEKMRKELTEYREALRDVAIERDPEFKQRFGTRQDAAIGAAKLAAGEKSGKLEALLKAPAGPWRDEQINALIEELPSSSQRRINAALGVLEQIDVERESEIASRRATFEQKQSHIQGQNQRQQEEQMRRMNGIFESTLKGWTDPKSGNPFFVERDGDDKHNSAVKESVEFARSIFSGQMEPQDIVNAALWASQGPRALEGWREATARAEKAEKMLDRIRGVQPGAGRSGGVSDSPSSSEAPKPGTPAYDQYMVNGLQQAQLRDRQRGG